MMVDILHIFNKSVLTKSWSKYKIILNSYIFNHSEQIQSFMRKMFFSAPLATSVPYKVLHEPPVKFNSVHRKVFIPGVEIKVRFVENERSATTHLLNPNL